MLIDNAATKSRFGHYQHLRAEHHGADKFPYNRSEIDSPRHRETGRRDRLQLSDAARSTLTQENSLDLEKTPDTKHVLSIQIIRSMVKAITGRDLQFMTPQALQGQTEQVTVREPTQAPDSPATSDSGSVYQISKAGPSPLMRKALSTLGTGKASILQCRYRWAICYTGKAICVLRAAMQLEPTL